MHVCASPLMRCTPLALPHWPTARYSHQRRRHLYICAFHFLLTTAGTAPPAADGFAKATSPVALPCLLCGARFTTYGVRTKPAFYRYPRSRPSGISPVFGYPALSPGPPLSPDKNVHDHLPLPCTAATASCAQVDEQIEWLYPFHSSFYAHKRNTAAYRPPAHLRHRARIAIHALRVQHKPLCEIESYAICISSQHTCNLHVGAMTYSPIATRPGPPADRASVNLTGTGPAPAVPPQRGTAC